MTFDELTKEELLVVIPPELLQIYPEARVCAAIRSESLRQQANAEMERYQALASETLATVQLFNECADLGQKLVLAKHANILEGRAQTHFRRAERYTRRANDLSGFKP